MTEFLLLKLLWNSNPVRNLLQFSSAIGISIAHCYYANCLAPNILAQLVAYSPFHPVRWFGDSKFETTFPKSICWYLVMKKMYMLKYIYLRIFTLQFSVGIWKKQTCFAISLVSCGSMFHLFRSYWFLLPLDSSYWELCQLWIHLIMLL